MKPAPFDLHPSVAYVQAVIANLPAKTGKDLAAWVALARSAKLADGKALGAWLKSQGLGGTQAGLVAERALALPGHAFSDTPEGYLAAAAGYVDSQYSGTKVGLRPIFDTVLTWARKELPGVKVCPCETIVPLYREHVFAQLKPTTRTRVDLGLALGDPNHLKASGGPLVDTGGYAKKDRITVRLELKAPADFNAKAQAWLRAAFERDAS
ncbi:MAG TPA: DUF5655 domain-containing protein [Holophagaceae bacterium]|nr:DUF5655 domain-containing protein [Holophagaceae bacterium]HJW33442.1 DUF5655 domain-containing protein [Holophagaceae bacterium]